MAKEMERMQPTTTARTSSRSARAMDRSDIAPPRWATLTSAGAGFSLIEVFMSRNRTPCIGTSASPQAD